jgi:hypothetical protein
LPAINRANVGTLTPLDLLFAINLFNAKYGQDE